MLGVTVAKADEAVAEGGVLKLHSKRVEKNQNYTRNEWKRCKTPLETSGKNKTNNPLTPTPPLQSLSKLTVVLALDVPLGWAKATVIPGAKCTCRCWEAVEAQCWASTEDE